LTGLLPYGLVLLLGGLALAFVASELEKLKAETIVFQKRGALLLLVGAALVAWVGFHLHARQAATFSFSRVGDLSRIRPGLVSWLSPLPRALRVVTLVLLALALARPQTFRRQEIEVEGIDIMLVLDLSKSMSERDLLRNRLDAAQRTIRKFLIGRKNDRMGLVVFAKEAMVQCPLTLDYGALDTIVSDLALGDIEGMGTAIGDGLGLALASLRRSDAKSKVMILLSDGDSNVVNEMNPDEAKALAKTMGVRVFTVLIGREAGGPAQFDPFSGRQGYSTNPELLKSLAAETRGKYFHAGDSAALERGFEEVRATLEKSKRREVGRVYVDLFPALVTPALGLLLLEILLSLTRFRKFP
jgi:Ca-activated chloride channel family protein